jgi:pimeloyl-ACP methyl ester carboxylesterase
MSMNESMVETNGVQLCVQTLGDRNDPAILLIHGSCASLLWWETGLCQRLAAAGRFVIRYDNRDTGRSTSYPPGQPNYSLSDMARDAVGILEHLGVKRAHIVGRSMAGAIALVLAVDHPDRVTTVTFVASTTGDDDLPGMSDSFLTAVSATPDPTRQAEVVNHIVNTIRAYSGPSVYFDEKATRALAVRDVARTKDIAAALSNHFAIDFDGPRNGGFEAITAPALVIHGENDPVYPLEHGEALRAASPGARLTILPAAGHEVPEPLWGVFVDALIGHTQE